MTRRSNIGSKVNHRIESEPVTIEMEPNVNYLDATPLPYSVNNFLPGMSVNVIPALP